MTQKQKEAAKRYRERHPEKVRARLAAWRQKNKERLSEYNKANCKRRYYANWEKILAGRRIAYRTSQKIREARAEEGKHYREHNRKRIAERKRLYVQKNREKVAVQVRRWREAHLKEVREKKRMKYASDPNAYKAKAMNWAKANPEKRRAIKNKHRALKAGSAVGDRDAYAAFVRRARNTAIVYCHWCKKAIPKGKRHIDHMIPLSRGGADDVANLCVACAPCNCSKGAKLPHEFLPIVSS